MVNSVWAGVDLASVKIGQYCRKIIALHREAYCVMLWPVVDPWMLGGPAAMGTRDVSQSNIPHQSIVIHPPTLLSWAPGIRRFGRDKPGGTAKDISLLPRLRDDDMTTQRLCSLSRSRIIVSTSCINAINGLRSMKSWNLSGNLKRWNGRHCQRCVRFGWHSEQVCGRWSTQSSTVCCLETIIKISWGTYKRHTAARRRFGFGAGAMSFWGRSSGASIRLLSVRPRLVPFFLSGPPMTLRVFWSCEIWPPLPRLGRTERAGTLSDIPWAFSNRIVLLAV